MSRESTLLLKVELAWDKQDSGQRRWKAASALYEPAVPMTACAPWLLRWPQRHRALHEEREAKTNGSLRLCKPWKFSCYEWWKPVESMSEAYMGLFVVHKPFFVLSGVSRKKKLGPHEFGCLFRSSRSRSLCGLSLENRVTTEPQRCRNPININVHTARCLRKLHPAIVGLTLSALWGETPFDSSPFKCHLCEGWNNVSTVSVCQVSPSGDSVCEGWRILGRRGWCTGRVVCSEVLDLYASFCHVSTCLSTFQGL